jgi:hypothetical protein
MAAQPATRIGPARSDDRARGPRSDDRARPRRRAAAPAATPDLPGRPRRVGSRSAADRAAWLERRRRERHWRALRRDLVQDMTVALLLMLLALLLTAGLGVMALLELPVGAAVVGSFIAERARAKRRR